MFFSRVPIQPGFKPLFPTFLKPGYMSGKASKEGGGYPYQRPNVAGVAASIRGIRPTALGVIK